MVVICCCLGSSPVAEAVLAKLDEGSDCNLSDDEVEDVEPQPISTDERTDDESEVESDTPTSAAVGKQKSVTPWNKVTKKSQFEMRETSENVDNSAAEQRENWTARQYFESYIGHDVYKKMAECTNRRAVETVGRSLNTTTVEIKRFWGISMLASCLGYPRIRMFWASVTRVPRIADTMSRNRYFKLRSNIKVVNDVDVSEEDRKADRLWKVRPLLNAVREGCLQQKRETKVSIDEQMIPFSGTSQLKQYVPNKPNPVGLKNFVLANPNGLVLDFRIYAGKETFSDISTDNDKLGLGGKVVVCLTQSMPKGSVVFCDRYFTTVALVDDLLKRGIYCTGTIMKNRIQSVGKKLKGDKELTKDGRGTSDAVKDRNNKICLVKWFDNKPITLMSSFVGINPEGSCRRWSKKDSKYIEIKCPKIVQEYNKHMGGVDMSDRLISYYRIKTRTKKWTVRTFCHMFDLALVNSWIQYRDDRQQIGCRPKEIMQLLAFKLDVAESLISECESEDSESEPEPESEPEDEAGQARKRKSTPLPSVHKRVKGTHLPEMDLATYSSRCRNPGCSQRRKIRCTFCNVPLCLTATRNCFKDFHNT